ncbi:MAG: hypothetical protein RI957_595 [Verrucomicrobiota bacterium]|jgi:hypothetical protein
MNPQDRQSETQSAHTMAWIFPWRRSFRRRWSLLVSILFVLPILALLLTTVRVRVFFTPPALNRSAELVLIPDLAGNRAWLETIAQRTPFPAVGPPRPVEVWSDAALRAELRPDFHAGLVLRSVDVPDTQPVFDQDWWWPPLEEPANTELPSPTPQNKSLQPRLRWLVALKPEQLPVEWPEYVGPVGMIAGNKYMVEVDADGRVVTCISAAKESDSRSITLENWLRRLRFPPAQQALGWLACEITWEYKDD